MRKLVLLALLSGCGGAEVVVVHVDGARVGLSGLGVTASLDQKTAQEYEQYPSSTLDFGLAMPDGASGLLQVDVGGLKGNCIFSVGTASTEVGSASRADITITLTPVPGSGC